MSQITDSLSFLTNNASEMVARNANEVLKYQQALQTGQITKEEYLDLMNDLAANVRIAQAADDLQNKILLEQCINIAIAASGMI